MTDLPPKSVELIRILASVDSLFSAWPCPKESNSACFAVSERQRAYRDGRGLPWTVGGASEQRMAGGRILGALEADGLVTTYKAAGSHRHVGLTPGGDDFARSLLGYYRCCECWNVFRGLAEAVERGPGRWATAEHVAEGLGGDELAAARGMILPLLARGLVESAASSVSETIFTVRPEKLELAADDPPPLLVAPEPDQRFNDEIFLPTFFAAEADKPGLKPSRPNCCYVAVLN